MKIYIIHCRTDIITKLNTCKSKNIKYLNQYNLFKYLINKGKAIIFVFVDFIL